MRYKLGESEAFKRNNMVHAPVPWVLTLKYYWFRLGTSALPQRMITLS